MKRFSLLSALLLTVTACQTTAPSTAPVASPAVKVIVVGTTDVHGWFNGHTDVPESGGPGVRYGGLAILDRYVNVLREQNGGRVLLVDSGDMFQGTLESNLFEGESVIRGYNALGYTAAAVGNHEFDFGPLGPPAIARNESEDPLGALKRNVKLAKFPFLAANVHDKATGVIPTWAKPYTIVEMGGARIGIIGLSTPDTPNVTMRANVESLDFLDPVPVAIRYATELRQQQNVDAVIVIAHIGGRCTDLKDPYTTHSCDRQHEAMRFLEAMPAGTIDAFFGGHTHAQMRHVVNGIPTLQAMPYSREFSSVELMIDPAANKVLQDRTTIRQHTMICSFVYEGTEQCDARKAAPQAKLTPRVFEGQPIFAERRVVQLFEPYLAKVAEKRNEKIGVVATAPFTRSYSRESALGNLMADAIREATGADIGFFNSGGIRSDLRAGDLVYGDIFEVSPFDNYPAVITMTGVEVAEAIRLASAGERGLMQVSGIKYTVDALKDKDKPQDVRNRVVTISLADGSPLDPQKLYRVAMPDFIAAGGDGLMPLTSALPAGRIVVQQDRPVREYVIDAFRKWNRPLTPKIEGRVTVLNLPDTGR
jgi:5'-nucleotidase